MDVISLANTAQLHTKRPNNPFYPIPPCSFRRNDTKSKTLNPCLRCSRSSSDLISSSMASACSRIAQRSSISSIKSAIKSNIRASSCSKPPSSSSPLRRSFATRIAPELRCVQSMLPLHSAVAVARMTSCLSITSRSCRALSQGTLCCTSPGL
ncbi:hypothetical protein VNO77_24974 [Canavalia gladiata]|uniref:Uncharacterized protein n=1 Tax=Canavalia gladiata TaxID=3824 RepID=A0AAN9LAP4_CANGL